MIFVDSSFFVAMLLARDSHHREAVDLAERQAGAGWLTTNHVVGETWTYLRRRAGRGPAVAFLDAINASPLHSPSMATLPPPDSPNSGPDGLDRSICLTG